MNGLGHNNIKSRRKWKLGLKKRRAKFFQARKGKTEQNNIVDPAELEA